MWYEFSTFPNYDFVKLVREGGSKRTYQHYDEQLSGTIGIHYGQTTCHKESEWKDYCEIWDHLECAISKAKKELKDFGSLSSQHIFLGFLYIQWS